MKIRFPLQFTSANFNKIVPISLQSAKDYMGEEILQGFSQSFTNVLQAMADFDYEYLSNTMEPRLYQATKECLNDLKAKEYSLEYIEGEELDENGRPKGEIMKLPSSLRDSIYEEKDLHMSLRGRILYGVHIDRSKNVGFPKRIESDFFPMGLYFNPKMTWKEIYRAQILSVEVNYFTSRKLILKDEEGQLLEGVEDPNKRFYHSFIFESYSYKDEFDWILCDIDNFLKGNPHFSSENDAKENV